MEISIDRRGEGSDAVKISVAVRSLDTKTHSTLGQSDRDEVSAVLRGAGRDIEKILTGRRSLNDAASKAP